MEEAETSEEISKQIEEKNAAISKAEKNVNSIRNNKKQGDNRQKALEKHEKILADLTKERDEL
jgi:hypothetical protein